MAFNPFTFPGGKPTPAASVEQSALLACLYWDSQSAAQAMIDAAGGGKILAWQFSQTSYPPSFFIWQDNSNNIGIVVIGTQNASQMTGNILSAASQPYPGSGCEVHGYWALWSSSKSNLRYLRHFLPTCLRTTCWFRGIQWVERSGNFFVSILSRLTLLCPANS